MKLINPSKIKKGDLIAIISPSAGLGAIFPHRMQKGKEMLEELGFKVIFSENALKIKDWVSADPEARAMDINNVFKRTDVRAIICSIGGNHSNQILKYLDFNLIRKNPKIFLGYSDITIINYALAKKSNLRTFYGPCLMPEFGEYPKILPYTLEYFLKATTKIEALGKISPSELWTDEFLDWAQKKDLESPRKLFKSNGYHWWKEGFSEGMIWGGAIPSINHLAGTDYWINHEKAIFFIDIPEGDHPEQSFSLPWLDSYLSDLDNLGIFSKISGLIIGRPYKYRENEESKLKEIILNYTKNYSYPILYNVNIGHTSPIITLPLGVRVKIDSRNNLFEILEPGVK